jgi:hypothetical protein
VLPHEQWEQLGKSFLKFSVGFVSRMKEEGCRVTVEVEHEDGHKLVWHGTRQLVQVKYIIDGRVAVDPDTGQPLAPEQIIKVWPQHFAELIPLHKQLYVEAIKARDEALFEMERGYTIAVRVLAQIEPGGEDEDG